MSDDRRLRERLRALSAAGLSGPDGRRIRGPGRVALLTRVLAEIDRSVMPRLIRLGTDDGRFVVIEVANRRLGRITAGGGDPALGALTGTDFAAEADEAAPGLRALFEALVAGTEGLKVRSDAVDHQLDPERAGLSARKLAELLDLPAPEPLPDDPAAVIDAFLSRVSDAATAWLILSDTGGEREGAGDEAVLEALEAQAERLPPAPEGETWALTALGGAAQAHGFTLAADAGPLRVVLAVPADRLGAVADAWRDLTMPPPALTGQ